MDIQIDFRCFEEELGTIPLIELAEFVLSRLQVPAQTQVSLTFVPNDEITQLNEQYRGKQGPTDVLSFECDGLEDDFGSASPEAPFVLGDIVIAPNVARDQAHEYGTTFSEEISVLVMHGLCHLAGYDHETDEDAAEMEPLEEELLKAWGKRSDGEGI